MIALLASLALAGPQLVPSLSLGYEQVVNDPFVQRRGLRLAADLDVGPWVGAELSGGYYPDLERHDWKAITQQLEQDRVVPDLSRILATGRAELLVFPLHQGSTRLGLGVGGVLVRTRDDLWAMGLEDQYGPSTDEVHPGPLVELRGEAWRGRLGLRTRLEKCWYTETILEEHRERKGPVWVGAELVWRPGKG